MELEREQAPFPGVGSQSHSWPKGKRKRQSFQKARDGGDTRVIPIHVDCPTKLTIRDQILSTARSPWHKRLHLPPYSTTHLITYLFVPSLLLCLCYIISWTRPLATTHHSSPRSTYHCTGSQLSSLDLRIPSYPSMPIENTRLMSMLST
jgi:hypothetical protein